MNAYVRAYTDLTCLTPVNNHLQTFHAANLSPTRKPDLTRNSYAGSFNIKHLGSLKSRRILKQRQAVQDHPRSLIIVRLDFWNFRRNSQHNGWLLLSFWTAPLWFGAPRINLLGLLIVYASIFILFCGGLLKQRQAGQDHPRWLIFVGLLIEIVHVTSY